MRIPIGILALSACAQLAIAELHWKTLPYIPQGTPRSIAGNGSALYAVGGQYGFMQFLPSEGWTALAFPGTIVSSPIAKDSLVAFDCFNRSGDIYGDRRWFYLKLGDRSWKNPSYGTSILATDGMRFLGLDYNMKPVISVDTTPNADKTIPWRKIASPGVATNGWIEGATIVLGNGQKSWISRDTGATFESLVVPDLAELAIRHDTLLATSSTRNRMYRSLDNGLSWDSTIAIAPSGPRRLCFRGGYLWAQFLKTDTSRAELARSADAGKTWSTTLADIGKDAEIAWDGRYFWAHSLEDRTILRSPDKGSTWVSGSDMPVGSTTKLRAVSGGLLALRSWGRNLWDKGRELWFWDGLGWFKLRDSLRDFEVRKVGASERIFVVADRSTSEDSASELTLQWSDDRTTWTKTDRKPTAAVLGNSPLGILLAEGTNLSMSQNGTDWRSIRMEQTKGRTTRFLAMPRSAPGDTVALWGTSAGIFRWMSNPAMHQQPTPPEQAIPYLRTMDYVSVGGRLDILVSDTAAFTTQDLATTATGMFYAAKAHGAAPMGDSILVWGQANKIWVWKDSGSRELVGPAGITPVLVHAQGGEIQGPFPAQSAIYVVDENGFIHEGTDDLQSGIGPRDAPTRSMRIEGRSIRVDLGRPARIRLEIVSLDGKRTFPGPERNSSTGRAEWFAPKETGIVIARLWADGKVAEVRRIALPAR